MQQNNNQSSFKHDWRLELVLVEMADVVTADLRKGTCISF